MSEHTSYFKELVGPQVVTKVLCSEVKNSFYVSVSKIFCWGCNVALSNFDK